MVDWITEKKTRDANLDSLQNMTSVTSKDNDWASNCIYAQINLQKT
jgi:hypothetical protein